jgi:hypothetical protein
LAYCAGEGNANQRAIEEQREGGGRARARGREWGHERTSHDLKARFI